MWKGTKSLQPQTEENQGRKPEPAKDKVRFVIRVFSFCTLPEPGVRASALASMKASFTSGSSQLTTIQQRGSRETSGGHEREGGREGRRGPGPTAHPEVHQVLVPQPAVPPERPGHESG